MEVRTEIASKTRAYEEAPTLANKRRKVAITPISDSLRGPRENKWGQIQPDSLPIFTKEVHIESRTIARRALLRCCRFRSAF